MASEPRLPAADPHPAEQRLHPASVLFALGRSLKAFALPGLFVLFTAGRSSAGPAGPGGAWEAWMLLLLIPSTIHALARYLSFRIRYDGTELVIRSGLIFRNERHVPYARIQNLDGVENVLHRLLGVVEVRVETGAGNETEARISVLPVAAFTEMRRRVFAGREAAGIPAGGTLLPDPADPAPSTLLQLSMRELLLYGLLESRGLVVIGAAYGLLWELGLLDWVWGRVLGDVELGRGVIRRLLLSTLEGAALPWRQIGLAALGIVALLVAARLASMAWAAVRLAGFRLSRAGDDLRTEFGLFTRVTATIPVRRIQTLTLRQSPLQRLTGRTSIRVETAGGRERGAGPGSRERQWIAPIVRVAEAPALARGVLPELDLAALPWQGPHPRAIRRALKPALVAALLPAILLARPLRWWALAVLAVSVAWAIYAARQHVAHLRWAVTDDVVVFGSGWLWRTVTVARVAKIQAVTWAESPFDCRTAMARVRVDTAGASEGGHRVAIPFLPRDTAQALHRLLAARAASTAFRW